MMKEVVKEQVKEVMGEARVYYQVGRNAEQT
jgi:hypothetical protein